MKRRYHLKLFNNNQFVSITTSRIVSWVLFWHIHKLWATKTYKAFSSSIAEIQALAVSKHTDDTVVLLKLTVTAQQLKPAQPHCANTSSLTDYT